MKIRSFVIAYALVLAILLFADRRPGPAQENRYSRVIDLTEAQSATAPQAAIAKASGTRIIAPADLIPGTWSAGQIPPERLIAPLVVMDSKTMPDRTAQITLDDIAAWESRHGVVPQGAVVAIRRVGNAASGTLPPITGEAAQFLMDARYVLGFAIETRADLSSDRTLSRQLALHGNYVVEGVTRLSALPETGSLVIVAPLKNRNAGEDRVRLLAMVK
jgi:kynurenine formamidase